MVIKRCSFKGTAEHPFESSVISYGDKTNGVRYDPLLPFESSVISYGDKTSYSPTRLCTMFESSVISYGDKT